MNKVMKATEKLYFGENDKEILDIYSTKESDNEVEYVRTDAFIEKAWEWVDMHFHETEVDDRWGESRCVVMSEHDSFKDDLLKGFKEYMKGE